MPVAEFDYHAIDTGGRERRGRVAAATADEARARLGDKKLYVVSVEPGASDIPRASPLLSRALFRRNRLSASELTSFTYQLAALAQVSPLEEALHLISRQTEKEGARAVVRHVHAGVFEGRRLADAMALEPNSFPALYRAMIAAGEGSGTLPDSLIRLASLLERQAQVRSKLIAALAYPLVLAVVASGVVMALMIFVVPKVVEQFDTNGQPLPLLTRLVIGVSSFLSAYWWALLIGAGVAAFGIWRALKDDALRRRIDTVLLRMPFLGRLIRDLHAARMARTLATMVASRLPLIEGVALTVPTVRNHALRAASSTMVDLIRGGTSLSTAMRRAAVFPPLLVYLTASGEASGQLDTMLERAADTLEREFDSFTAAAMSLLEPTIIVLMGGVVAAIILSIMLPILQLESLAGL
jgi:general secretion pathway protein F